jgi:hypothetical protein
MSDFLKKFKSVFIVEDGTGNKPAVPVTASAPTAQAPAPTPEPAQTSSPVQGAVSDRFTGILTAALEKNNQTGFDYFEFRQALPPP